VSHSCSGCSAQHTHQISVLLCALEKQADFFAACGLAPLLNAAVDGFACTAFVYGATGSGKTYSMSGLEQVAGKTAAVAAAAHDGGASDGLVPRSMQHMFERMRSAPPETKYRVRASYCEIYNEQVLCSELHT
jgi:Kinesin motor domain